MNNWYPQDKDELNLFLDKLMKNSLKIDKKIHGLIVPHAGYQFSGGVAGKAFGLLKDKKITKAIVVGPSHYFGFLGIKALDEIITPLGKVEIIENNFEKLKYEHSIDNQIPFLQKLNPKIKILPLVIGEISNSEAEKIAKEILKLKDDKTIFVFSTDLSHFLPYKKAIEVDKKTIKIIKNLEIGKWNEIDACGVFPLLIMMHLCKLKNYKPHLIEYKNSGDIIGDKNSVVGYAGFSL